MGRQENITQFDLNAEIERFLPDVPSGRRSETLIKTPRLRVVLITMRAGTELHGSMSPPDLSPCSRSVADSPSRPETTSGKSCPARSSLSRAVFVTLSAPWRTGRSCSRLGGPAEMRPATRARLTIPIDAEGR